MTRLFLISLCAAALGGAAYADQLEVEPGAWTYQVTARLGAIPLTESGVECVTAATARRSLSRTAAAIADGCRLSGLDAIPGGYRFTLSCVGRFNGEAEGRVTTDGETARLTASGRLRQEGAEVPVSIQGRAERTAPAC